MSKLGALILFAPQCPEKEIVGTNQHAYSRTACRLTVRAPGYYLFSSRCPSLIHKKMSSSSNRSWTTLTHPINEVRWYVASGIGKHLWTIDRELALRCVNALATEADTNANPMSMPI